VAEPTDRVLSSVGAGLMRSKGVRARRIFGALVILVGLLIGFLGFMALAQAPDDRDTMAAELIGVRVFSADGAEVGTVSAVTVGADGDIAEIRLTTSSPLGLGERTVAVGRESFIILQGAVVLDMSAAEVDALPVKRPPRLRGTRA
jgi:PRC-barrel domain